MDAIFFESKIRRLNNIIVVSFEFYARQQVNTTSEKKTICHSILF